MADCWLYTYLRVGFCVARFDNMGSAKASNRETSSDTDSHAFLCQPPTV